MLISKPILKETLVQYVFTTDSCEKYKKKKKRVKPRTSEFFSNFRQYEIIKLFLEP